MTKKLILFLFVLSMTTSYAQISTDELLIIKPEKPLLDFNKFNSDLKKALNKKTLSIYTFNDLAKNDFSMVFYNKPISTYAYENFREIEFYKKSIPKEINLLNFQRDMPVK